MKTVVSNREVFHLWAHQTQDSARGHGSVSFEGTRAYSYRACIGRIVTNGEGSRVAFLVSSRSYSNTTSKHQSYLRSAIPSGELVFPVYDVGDNLTNQLASMTENLPDMALKVTRSRNHGESYLRQFDNQIALIHRFCQFFALTLPELPTIGEEVRERVYSQPARQTRVYGQTESTETQQENLLKWLNGESVRGSLPYGPAYLRISPKNPAIVETSQGATVPTEEVKRATPLVLRAMESGVGVFPENMMLGHYRLTAITPTFVRVGCHTFTSEEVRRFAQVIG